MQYLWSTIKQCAIQQSTPALSLNSHWPAELCCLKRPHAVFSNTVKPVGITEFWTIAWMRGGRRMPHKWPLLPLHELTRWFIDGSRMQKKNTGIHVSMVCESHGHSHRYLCVNLSIHGEGDKSDINRPLLSPKQIQILTLGFALLWVRPLPCWEPFLYKRSWAFHWFVCTMNQGLPGNRMDTVESLIGICDTVRRSSVDNT